MSGQGQGACYNSPGSVNGADNRSLFLNSILQTPDGASRRDQDSMISSIGELTDNFFPSPGAGNQSGYEFEFTSTPTARGARGTPNRSIWNSSPMACSPSPVRLPPVEINWSPAQRPAPAENATIQEVFQDARAFLDALSPNSSASSGSSARSGDSPPQFGNTYSVSDAGSCGTPPQQCPNGRCQVQVSPRNMQGSPQAARVFDVRGLQTWVLNAVGSVAPNTGDISTMEQLDREEQTLRFMIQLVTSWRSFLQASTAFTRLPPQGNPNATNNTIGSSPQSNLNGSYTSSSGNSCQRNPAN